MTEQMCAIQDALQKCVAALGKTPKALLFVDGETEWTYDLAEFSGIPVLHGTDIHDSLWGSEPYNCPFIPLGATDGEITGVHRKRFASAWVTPACLDQAGSR